MSRGTTTMSRGIRVDKPNDIPRQQHWAIISKESVQIPGDERSRTNPGHGYPAHTREFIGYEAFLVEEEFKAEVERRLQAEHSRSGFICIRVDNVALPKIRAEIDWEKPKPQAPGR